jgi:hypothetical protein
VIEVDEEDEEIAELKAACDNLEVAVERIGEVDDPRQENGVCSYDIGLDGPDELDGPDAIPCSHEAIFNHSRWQPHTKWVWITQTSMVDKEGNLGYPASAEDVGYFGARARKVFLR